MNNKLLDNLETDINLLIRDNFHPKHQDLINVTIKEEIFELIKFARKVNEVLDEEIGPTSGDYMSGYKEGIQQVRKQIYGLWFNKQSSKRIILCKICGIIFIVC